MRDKHLQYNILGTIALLGACLGPAASVATAGPVHTSYLWHLHQPIYWPDRESSGADRYEYAAQTIAAKNLGRTHPVDDVNAIFTVPDRVAAYQGRPWDAISNVLDQPDAGAQVTYTGSLIENVNSLVGGGYGYNSGWQTPFSTGRASGTTNSNPRLDMVNFAYHHSLAPLQTDKTFEMELRLMQRQMQLQWGTSKPVSRGYFPTEMAFSERLIPTLKAQGIDWSIVSGNHLSRACADFPLVLGSGGENTEPPNQADVINPAQGASSYYRLQISRGCAPCNAAPFAYTPHQAQYVDPDTGTVTKIMVFPAAQEFGWLDGYQCFSSSDTGFGTVAGKNPSSGNPELILLAHDGDNAFGGGYSYYMQCVHDFVEGAASSGYKPSTVQQYLSEYTIPSSDVVHVEDGPWVNADGDFGSPTFINWNYPLLNSSGQPDPVNGWHEKPREYAVYLAAENRIRTAEQVSSASINLDHILNPSGATTAVEHAWHYYLSGLDSGELYYGDYGDVEVKGTIACNNAVGYTDTILTTGTFTDQTGPSVWIPQRWPYNPGSVDFGVSTQYTQKTYGPDFTVWTFAYDVSGLSNVTLKWRTDNDGVNSTTSTQNETYAGGSEVGAWQSMTMAVRDFPSGNIYNKSTLDYYVLPTYIAKHCSATITGQAGKLIDYYVEATDNASNITRTPIQHVYVGTQTGSGGGGGGSSRATVVPSTPIAGQQAMVQYDASTGPISSANPVYMHWGINHWATVNSDVAMTYDSGTSRWETTVTVASTATTLDCVFRNASNTYDNNSGADWHFTVTGGSPPPTTPWTIDGAAESASYIQSQPAGALKLYITNSGNVLYVGTDGATSAAGHDHFIFITRNNAGALRTSQWAKAGQVLTWDAFLAMESSNGYNAWFDANGSTYTGASTTHAANSSGVLEGSIDLSQLYSPSAPPSVIYVAAAAFGTSDGGSLIPSLQSPATVNSNTTLDASEFFAYTISSGVVDWTLY